MNLFSLSVFCAAFVYSYGDDAADEEVSKNPTPTSQASTYLPLTLQLRNTLNGLDGESATIRDDCVKTTSVQIADLKDYHNVDDTPEKDLCFYKCFYEGSGFLSEDGKFKVDAVDVLVALSKQKDIEVDKIKECVKDVDKIVECTDLLKLEKCFII